MLWKALVNNLAFQPNCRDMRDSHSESGSPESEVNVGTCGSAKHRSEGDHDEPAGTQSN